jgi:hypothetical protein
LETDPVEKWNNVRGAYCLLKLGDQFGRNNLDKAVFFDQ